MLRLPVLVALLSFFAAGVSAQQTAGAAPPTAPPPAASPSEESKAGRLKFGAGAHYMKTVGSISDAEAFDSDALNLLVAAKMGLGLLALEFDSEWALDYGGSDKTLWIPQLFALVDLKRLYGGVGVGSGYIDGEWFDQPVYTLRAGINLPLGRFALDVNANYQFMSAKAFENVDTEDLDSVTFGAVLWF